jgi:hypothetical protein
MYLHDLASCAALTTELAEEAAKSSSSLRSLFAWAADVARPGEGAPKILMALAWLLQADWLEGTPYVEVRGDEEHTLVSIFSQHGVGIGERVIPVTRLRVPVDEFARAVRLAPQLVQPFRAVHEGDSIFLMPPDLTLEETSASLSQRELITIHRRSLHVPAPPLPPSRPPALNARPSATDESRMIHTRPTVRRMVAVTPAARRGKDDGH